MEKVKRLIKGEVVLVIAILLGVCSCFVTPPSSAYLTYIDYRVLSLLFCFMLVVGGFRKLGVFRLMGEQLCRYAKNTRQLASVFVVLCFFLSMLVTNDVALITFVPFTISVFVLAGCSQLLIPVIVLETIAANLGSMLTPIGNPQNLLLFSLSQMGFGEFLLFMLPLTAVSFVLIMLGLFWVKKQELQADRKRKNSQKAQEMDYKKLLVYLGLFAVCLGNVFHLYSYVIVLVIVTVVICLLDRSLFAEVDYSLLFTFVGFFVFIGNMKQISFIHDVLSQVIAGNELLLGVLTSQIISNVPAAMLLSGFTTDYKALLYGVNAGGLGTLIASMASLISYRFYVKEMPQNKKTYFVTFTVANIILLLILLLFIIIVQPVSF